MLFEKTEEKKWHLIPIGVGFLVAFVIYVILGPGKVVLQKEGILDTYIPMFKLLRDHQVFFAQDADLPILLSVPRDYFPSEVHLQSILYWMFPAYSAYVVTYFVRVLLAISGFAMLAKSENKVPVNKYWAYVLGAAFGMAPVFPAYGIAFASLPWVLVLLRAADQKRGKVRVAALAGLLVYPFFSEWAHFMLPVLMFTLIYQIVCGIRQKKFPGWGLIGMVLMAGGYGLADYRFLRVVTDDGGALLHQIYRFEDLTVAAIGKDLLWRYVENAYTGGLLQYLILPAAVILWLVCSRFSNMTAKILSIAALLIALVCPATYNDLYHTVLQDGMSFRDYYSEDLFEQLKASVGYVGQWSESYGFDPAVLEYNGFRIIDGNLDQDNIYTDYVDRYYPIWGTRPEETSGSIKADFDTDDFKREGGYYLISSLSIENAEELGFEPVIEAPETNGVYELTLYRPLSRYIAKEHSDVPFRDRFGYEVDRDELQSTLDQMREMIDAASEYDENNSEAQLSSTQKEAWDAAYDHCVELIGDLGTEYALWNFQYYMDPMNEEYAENMDRVQTDYMDWSDLFFGYMRDACKTTYREAIEEEFGAGAIQSFLGYEDLTEEEKERTLKLESLEREYQQAALEDYYIDFEGEEWSLEKWQEVFDAYDHESDPDYTAYNRLVDIYYLLQEERGKTLGEIYLQILHLDAEVAEEEGYDNYAQYAYENKYSRDFSVDDVKKMCDEIISRGKTSVQAISALEREKSAADPGFITDDDEATYKMLLPYIQGIDPELGEAMEHLIKVHAYDLTLNENKPASGFTTALSAYGDAYIFDSPYGTSRDLFTYIHEFGHYNAEYYHNENYMEKVTNLDVAEIDSQGLEMLMCSKMPEILGEEVGEYMKLSDVSSIMTAVLDGSVKTEFEIYAHEHPDSTLDELAEKYYEIKKRAGLVSGAPDNRDYSWTETSHLFTSPQYYVSYVTSAMGALGVYTESLEDYDLAVEKYMELTALPTGILYRNAMSIADLPDAFAKGEAVDIMTKVYMSFVN